LVINVQLLVAADYFVDDQFELLVEFLVSLDFVDELLDVVVSFRELRESRPSWVLSYSRDLTLAFLVDASSDTTGGL